MENLTFIDNLAAGDPPIPADGILSRTLLKNEHAKLVWFGFAAGESLSEHTAAVPAILYFVEGEAACTFGEEKKQARAGTWVYMPARLPHSITAQTPLVMALLLLEGGSA